MRVSGFEGSWLFLCMYLGAVMVPYAGVARAQDWPNARYNDPSDEDDRNSRGGDNRRRGDDYDDDPRGDDRRRDDRRGNDRRGGDGDSRRRDNRQSGGGYDERRGGSGDSRRRDDRQGGGSYDDRRSGDYEDRRGLDDAYDARRDRADEDGNADGSARDGGVHGQPSSSQPSGDKVFNGTGVAILGSLGASSTLLLGIHIKDLLLSVGFSFGYNVATAGAATTSSASSSKVGFSLATSFAYMVYDARPLAFGPEVDLDMRLAPSPAVTGFTQLRPGFALWYAPFEAPLYIGTMVGLTLTFVKGADPGVSTEYGGFRIRWGF